MGNSIDLATSIFGNKRLENGKEPNVTIITGTAVSDSANGKVKVIIDGKVTGSETDGESEDNAIELATNPSVKTGDIVQITCVGGVSYSMTVTGVIGSGDSIKTDVDTAQSTANTAQSEADKAKKAANDAAAKADTLAEDLDASNAKITDLSTEVGILGTRVENATEKADESLTVATEAKQTATEVKTTADAAYENANEALTQSSSAVQAADKVQTTLSTEYSKTGEDTTYATQSDLTQTSESLTFKITTAQSTADTAKTNAATAQTTANTAKTNAATAQSTAEDAKKVATNYLSFDATNGLIIGDMTKSTLGANTQIVSDGVNIRSGSTNLAKFKKDSISLNSGLLKITSETDTSAGTYAVINSGNDNLKLIADDSYIRISDDGWIEIRAKDTLFSYFCCLTLYKTGEFIKIYRNSSGEYFSGRIYGETVLYNNEDHAMSGATTLSKACTNYTYLDVYCKDNDGKYIYQRVYNPVVGRMFTVMSQTLEYIKHKTFKIDSTTTIDTWEYSSGNRDTGEVSDGTYETGDFLNIIRVVGIA